MRMRQRYRYNMSALIIDQRNTSSDTVNYFEKVCVVVVFKGYFAIVGICNLCKIETFLLTDIGKVVGQIIFCPDYDIVSMTFKIHTFKMVACFLTGLNKIKVHITPLTIMKYHPFIIGINKLIITVTPAMSQRTIVIRAAVVGAVKPERDRAGQFNINMISEYFTRCDIDRVTGEKTDHFTKFTSRCCTQDFMKNIGKEFCTYPAHGKCTKIHCWRTSDKNRRAHRDCNNR